MLVGLSPKPGPPIKFKFVAISSNCLNLSTLFGSTNAANYGSLSPSQSTAKACSIVFCHHLITSSARANTFGGIVRPICFAVFRLITNSNLVGCSTGKSTGLTPLRILSTKIAARCHW